MVQRNMQRRQLVFAVCLALLLSGCGGKEYTYVDGRDLKTGPGLLSGEDGTFTVLEAKPARQAEKSPAETGANESQPQP